MGPVGRSSSSFVRPLRPGIIPVGPTAYRGDRPSGSQAANFHSGSPVGPAAASRLMRMPSPVADERESEPKRQTGC